MKIGNASYVIGKLVRSVAINVYDWGINAVVMDKSNNRLNSRFYSRNFKKTRNFNTIEDNIKRAMKHYKAPQPSIEFMLECYKINQ